MVPFGKGDWLPHIMQGCLGIGLLTAYPIFAQTYSIEWQSLAGGAGTISGGAYSIQGTIAQCDASLAIGDENCALTSGFWSFLEPALEQPVLSIGISNGGTVALSWKSNTSWILQGSLDLTPPHWATYGGEITTEMGINSVVVQPTNTQRFFRLAAPEQ